LKKPGSGPGLIPLNLAIELRSDAIGQGVVVEYSVVSNLQPSAIRLERVRHSTFFSGAKVLP
jgi:hypothetical protein